VKASEAYVPVRVLDMKGIDLNVFRFDFDLTFAALVMNADGTIYHHYGNRDATAADSHLSEASLARLLRDSLVDHAAYQRRPAPPPKAAPDLVEETPPMKERIARGKAPKCFHCHTVRDMRREMAARKGTWNISGAWRWPSSARVGFRLDRDVQTTVTEVTARTAAARAGLKVGDELVRVGGRRVRTEGDVQSVLDLASGARASIPLEWTRDGAAEQGVLRLAKGWKEGSPRELAWRSQMWYLDPRPGFGGKDLGADEKQELGLPRDGYALRIGYLVTWGTHSRTGRNARSAGLRKGDVVYSVDGKADFEDQRHFHAWFRMTRKIGKTAELLVLRDGKKKTVRLPIIE